MPLAYVRNPLKVVSLRVCLLVQGVCVRDLACVILTRSRSVIGMVMVVVIGSHPAHVTMSYIVTFWLKLSQLFFPTRPPGKREVMVTVVTERWDPWSGESF